MNRFPLFVGLFLVFSVASFAQKGIDTQTKSIRDQSQTQQGNNDAAGKTFSWGKDKTKIRSRMANPLEINSRFDILMDTVIEILKEGKMVIDEASSRFDSGLIVTRPFTFTKGAILAKNELGRYAHVPDTRDTWTRGQFSLTIDVKSIDGIKNTVSATAKVEGRIGDGLFSEWSTLPSSGEAEDEFLVELAKRIGTEIPENERAP